MTRQEFLKAASACYDKLQELNKLNDFYDYKVEFVNIWKDLGKRVLRKTLQRGCTAYAKPYNNNM